MVQEGRSSMEKSVYTVGSFCHDNLLSCTFNRQQSTTTYFLWFPSFEYNINSYKSISRIPKQLGIDQVKMDEVKTKQQLTKWELTKLEQNPKRGTGFSHKDNLHQPVVKHPPYMCTEPEQLSPAYMLQHCCTKDASYHYSEPLLTHSQQLYNSMN